MNIYNFIFCFFCKKDGNSGPGRIYGSEMLIFSILMHFNLSREILSLLLGHKVLFFQDNLTKDKYYLIYGLTVFVFVLFYDNKRVERLMEQYYSRDEYVQQRDTNKIILYIVIPLILSIVLAVIRQKYYGI
jgi:hypothetical protein